MGATACTRTEIFARGFVGGKPELVITSEFNNRKYPHAGFHTGVDIRCSSGTPLTCPVSKAVIHAYQTGGGGGQRLYLRYNNGKNDFFIIFMHLHTCPYTSADIGKVLKKGDPIGTSGGDPKIDKKNICGNWTTGAHLHLEVRLGSNKGTSAVDPKIYFLAHHVLKIKTARSWAGEPYNANGYVAGVNAYFQTQTHFCEEDVLTVNDVKRGSSASASSVTEAMTESNTETEFEQPKRKSVPGAAGERLALGIWQITKMVMDSSVQDKQLCDSSIGVQTGSMMSFFQKVCQQPLVEFFGDTYGNQYYWMVRRPPFDREGYLRMLDSMPESNNVSEDDIISSNLAYETGSIYSWYRLVPTGDVLGVSEQSFMIPAVFFPEYAAIWGSKPLDIQSLYYNFTYSGIHDVSTDKQKKENVNNITRRMVLDFKYLIESNAYRAFSMAGSITLKGSRKIKRGTMIRLDNGQVFHVDGVSHSFDISETSVRKITTIQVSHGIYANFISNKPTKEFGEVSYFNLIDFDNFDIEDYDNSNYRDKIGKWKVNSKCLNYFLAKLHLENSNLV